MSNEFITDSWLAAEDGLARRLREARTASGMTGKLFAETTRLQPARISRIENGKAVPREEEITAWASACGLDAASTNELLAILEAYREQRIDNETRNRYGLAGVQVEYNKLFADTKHFRTFALIAVPGYLQVADYARAVLTEAKSLNKAPDDVEDIVAVRLRRAEYLSDQSKQFEIIVSEAALRFVLAAPDVMRAQIASLFPLVDRPNVRFGILPQGRRLRTIPQNSFGVYDDMLVTIETFAVEEKYRGAVPEKYVQVMDLLWEDAVQGDAARGILTKAMAALPKK